jgi:hypothetical protein
VTPNSSVREDVVLLVGVIVTSVLTIIHVIFFGMNIRHATIFGITISAISSWLAFQRYYQYHVTSLTFLVISLILTDQLVRIGLDLVNALMIGVILGRIMMIFIPRYLKKSKMKKFIGANKLGKS